MMRNQVQPTLVFKKARDLILNRQNQPTLVYTKQVTQSQITKFHHRVHIKVPQKLTIIHMDLKGQYLPLT